MAKIFSKQELIEFNEKMLNRGLPNEKDKIGYNKSDYGACVTYHYALSDAQIADLAKRLIKYSRTQLDVEREDMEATAEYYNQLSDGDRRSGVSVRIDGKDVILSFAYNTVFVETIKSLPARTYKSDMKAWAVPKRDIHLALKELENVGADVKNIYGFLELNSDKI